MLADLAPTLRSPCGGATRQPRPRTWPEWRRPTRRQRAVVPQRQTCRRPVSLAAVAAARTPLLLRAPGQVGGRRRAGARLHGGDWPPVATRPRPDPARV